MIAATVAFLIALAMVLGGALLAGFSLKLIGGVLLMVVGVILGAGIIGAAASTGR